MKQFWLVVFVVSSCIPKTGSEGKMQEVTGDSLAAFPLNYEMEFVGTNSNDQIAVQFKRKTNETFDYRIELSKKWRGLPFDYCTVRCKEIIGDSTFIFTGGNSECSLILKIQVSNESWTRFVAVDRVCDKREDLNIDMNDFPLIWNKGGGLRK